MAAQLAEQLLKIGQRNLLACADGSQRNGAGVLAQGEIDHGGNGKTAFGGQSHEILLVPVTARLVNESDQWWLHACKHRPHGAG
ncbi:hypothetical protein LRS03_01720 [Rhizobacter sp. J219]|uniref:hypothetical protein n=1 Tax=Rhizobacter sp. J219 TaxID=2898430 RepID=UPI0021514EC8|nr:hypothetical protein [Rhizobacter sp. J219]MCR5881646.1 hypothetical protein [Rhizobacter sp. J219]